MSYSSTAAVTSFTEAGFQQYGYRFIETFLKYWPAEVELYVYLEDFVLPISNLRLRLFDLRAFCPRVFKFKEQFSCVPQDWLKHAACKYAFKLHVVADMTCNRSNCQRVFWLDADLLTHTPVPIAFLHEVLPLTHYTSGLFRPLPNYTECSFVGYNTIHPYHSEFVQRCLSYYAHGTVFDLEQWHDCWVYDTVRYQMEAEGLITSYDIGQGTSGVKHPFVNSPLGKYMDHLKGPRKKRGKSEANDLLKPRDEEYWQD